MPLLEVDNLTTCIPRRQPLLRPRAPRVAAVDNVSFQIAESSIVGLIGERGCGKTTLIHTIARLIPPSSGCVRYRDFDILKMSRRKFRPIRREIQILFQDCRASLNPFRPVETTLMETVCAADPKLSASAKRERAIACLNEVGLDAATARLLPRDLPHGHAERVALARALAAGIRFLMIDDSLRALDLRQQREFVDLLLGLREKLGLTCLFACHDFSLLMLIAEDAIVMARGMIVESASVSEIAGDPQHDFTKKLLASTLALN